MTRHFWAILLLLLCCCFAPLRAEEVKVTMKNGSTITGELKELIATDHITLIVAGIESTISMNDVISVEKASSKISGKNVKDEENLEYGKYEITDRKQYPDSFKITIGDQELTMILIRGGWFNMGYDDRHSWSWNTEPVHRVVLSSFYISKEILNRRIVDYIQHKKKISSSTKPYGTNTRKTAETIISNLATETMLPYRLPTEAEWEYTTLMPFADAIFEENDNNEWCSDYWEKYPAADQINPKGPSSGKSHVLRSYSSGNNKWKRMKGDNATQKKEYSFNSDAFLRIAISADQIQ